MAVPVPRDVPAVGPGGEDIFTPETETESLEASGGRVMSPEEATATQHDIAVKNEPFDITDYVAAGAHARLKGQGEALGLPVDQGIADIASLFAGPEGRKKTTDYIKKLEEVYPTTHAINHTLGQIGGAVAAGEITGGGEAGFLERAVRGGAENVVQNTAHDFNEQALGRVDANGEKMLSAMPKHFLVGALATGATDLGLMGIGKGLSSLSRRGATATDAAASRFVGRELGEEGAAAEAAGARVRAARGGEVPRNASELGDILGEEQAGYREAARAKHAALTEETVRSAEEAAATGVRAAEDVRGQNILDTMAEYGGKVESAEVAAARARDTVRREIREIDAFRSGVKAERDRAAELAEQFGKERATHDIELDKAIKKARDLGDADAAEASDYNVDDIMAILGSDKGDTATRMAVEASLAQSLGMEAPVMPGVSRFALAAKAAESAETKAAQLEVQRLTNLGAQIETAHQKAMAHVTDLDGAVQKLDFQYNQRLAKIVGAEPVPELDAALAAGEAAKKEGASATAKVTKEGDAAVRKAEKEGATSVEKAKKGIPKLDESTPVDEHIAALERKKNAPSHSGDNAALGAVISLSHGNVPGAIMSLLTGYAAKTARTEGNYVAARIMRGLSKELSKVDTAIQAGAMDAVRGVATRAAPALIPEEKKRKPTFDEVYPRVLEAQGNPLIIQARVQASMGHWAVAAPQLYASTLNAAERAQSFLESVLPEPQRDPYSLTPHLQVSDIPPSDRYDFMQYVQAIDDPIAVFKDVKSGNVTDQQIEAIKAVYPALYEQMGEEVDRQIQLLTKPMPYEREINVGRLLGRQTNEVLDPDFQTFQDAAYGAKAEAGAPVGSRAPSDESRVAKDTMSMSQKIEQGDIP